MKKKKKKTKEEQRSCDRCKGDGRGGECSQRSHDRWALGEGGEGQGQGGKRRKGGEGAGPVGGGGGGGGGGGEERRKGRGARQGGRQAPPLWARRALHSGSIRPVIPGPVRPVI